MTFLFWLSLLLLAYVYVGYPICVWLLAAIRPRSIRPPAGEFLPTVTVLIAAYNEARHIERTVRNKLEQDYPTDSLDIIVVSDESDDGTDEIVEAIGDSRVRLVRQQPRAGKTSGLNLIAPLASGEVLITSDANSFYAPDTVRGVGQGLDELAVGYVTGRMLYRAPDG